MKRGDIVHFKAGGFRTGQYRVLKTYDELVPPMCRISYGVTEATVRQSECKSDEQMKAEAHETATAKYADIIQAWGCGHQTTDTIAEFLNVPKQGLPGRIKAAQVRGLLA